MRAPGVGTGNDFGINTKLYPHDLKGESHWHDGCYVIPHARNQINLLLLRCRWLARARIEAA
jgi:hypothetical protein